MKKTIWQPMAIGIILGLLAGVGIAAGLSFIIPGAFSSVIGFFTTLFLLAAALGGPLAGVIASTICVVIAAFFGSPDLREALSDPVVFWSNVAVTGIFVSLVGFAYRWVLERVKMPARLLPWAGIVIAYYLLYLPANAGTQFYLNDDSGFIYRYHWFLQCLYSAGVLRHLLYIPCLYRPSEAIPQTAVV